MLDRQLSCYILTHDSETYLEQILGALAPVVDDLLLVDSGSTDRTETIARAFGARFQHRPLTGFSRQRAFAIEQCHFDWVLSVDSDEVPDEALVRALASLKKNRFRLGSSKPIGFQIERRWMVLGQEVHAFYPVGSPDYPVRLFRRDRVGFGEGTGHVHETPAGAEDARRLEGTLVHYTCETRERLTHKLDLYTSLAARDMQRRGMRARWWNLIINPPAAWVKWYMLKGGWRDGRVGLILGGYAYMYTYLKFRKLRELRRARRPS